MYGGFAAGLVFLLLCTVQFQRETEKTLLRRVEKKAANMLNLSSTTAALLNGIILGMLIFLDNDKTH